MVFILLSDTGKASVINRKFIADHSDDQARVYDAVIQLLQDNDRDTKVGRKNWGEIVSLTAAKAMGIPVMLSDEGNLQQIVDEYLNSGTNERPSTGDITIVRIKDFIRFMRDNGGNRKSALYIWVSSGRTLEMNARKHEFHTKLWPSS
jgi:hypothetical protein